MVIKEASCSHPFLSVNFRSVQVDTEILHTESINPMSHKGSVIKQALCSHPYQSSFRSVQADTEVFRAESTNAMSHKG